MVRADFDAMIRVAWWAVGGTVLAALIVHRVGLLAMNVPAVLCLAVACQLNSFCAVWLAHRVAEPLHAYFLSHLVNVGLTTLGIHFVGGVGFLPASLLYVLIVANGGIVGGAPAHVLAFASTVAYALLVALEVTGTVPIYVEPGVPLVAVDPRSWPGIILLVGVVLHVEAAYAGRLADLLHSRRRQLEEYRAAIEGEVRERLHAHEAAERAERERHRQSLRYRTFAHIITHGLKSPINAIYLTADVLLARQAGTLDPAATTAIDQIRGLEARIFDLMDLYRVISIQEVHAWVDLNELVADAVSELRPRIDAKGISVDVHRLPSVWGEYVKLGYVTSNLLSNAVKFVRSGAGRIEVSATRDARGVTLTVADNGIGVPEAYRERIFDLFAQVPSADRCVDGAPAQGTGVGLALVKRIVELHQGAISVRSEPAGGSRFEVWLPPHPPMERESTVSEPPSTRRSPTGSSTGCSTRRCDLT
jgi:signal transduction histidine kinase